MRIGFAGAMLLVAGSPLFAQTDSQPQQKTTPSQSSSPAPSGTANSQSAAPVDPQKVAAIRHPREVTGSKAMFNQMIQVFVQTVRNKVGQEGPGDEKAKRLGDLFFDKLQLRTVESFDSFQVLITPLYHKYYTTEDLEGLIKFYESPLGQKSLKATPEIMKELYPIAFEWGEGLGRRIANEIVQEHPELRETARRAFPEKT
jgi:hypothetical protein